MIVYNSNIINGLNYGSTDFGKIYYHNIACYQKVNTPKPTPVTKDYLRFVAKESGTFSFSTNAIEYSTNSGTTWTSLAANTSTPTIASGSTIYWRASGLTPTSSDGIGTFSSSGQFDVEGNVMSMLFGSDFENQTDLTGYNHAFRGLFKNNTYVVNASGMTLPATTLASGCYTNMFYGCKSLTTAPELPATTLASSCYSYMFKGCKSLTTAPELPATTLASYCYRNMFDGCTSLTTVPELPATTLATECYRSMFQKCTNLTTAPELPATTLASYCYRSMFDGCSKLSNIRCYATSISASNCTTAWVNGVASSGTFTKAASMASWTRGTNGIPANWTIKDK